MTAGAYRYQMIVGKSLGFEEEGSHFHSASREMFDVEQELIGLRGFIK